MFTFTSKSDILRKGAWVYLNGFYFGFLKFGCDFFSGFSEILTYIISHPTKKINPASRERRG
jgi:hypothetical protein